MKIFRNTAQMLDPDCAQRQTAWDRSKRKSAGTAGRLSADSAFPAG